MYKVYSCSSKPRRPSEPWPLCIIPTYHWPAVAAPAQLRRRTHLFAATNTPSQAAAAQTASPIPTVRLHIIQAPFSKPSSSVLVGRVPLHPQFPEDYPFATKPVRRHRAPCVTPCFQKIAPFTLTSPLRKSWAREYSAKVRSIVIPCFVADPESPTLSCRQAHSTLLCASGRLIPTGPFCGITQRTWA